MHSAQELTSQIDALTSLPTVYERIREQLQSPQGSVFEVARLVAADPALTARLLRLVNSAMYGHRGEIDNVVRAVQILGLQQVHDLVLAMSLHAMFAGIKPAQLDMNEFWRNSVLCALAARAIAQLTRHPGQERVFVIGLLADIGHLVLFQTTPVLADEARQIASQTNEALHLVERRIIGCDFAEVGATLMDQWRVPSSFATAIGTRPCPGSGASTPATPPSSTSRVTSSKPTPAAKQASRPPRASKLRCGVCSISTPIASPPSAKKPSSTSPPTCPCSFRRRGPEKRPESSKNLLFSAPSERN